MNDSNEEAVDDLLHWLCSYQHFPDFDIEVIPNMDGDADWQCKRQLSAAAIAEKYGVREMEEYAVQVCECFVDVHTDEIGRAEFAKCALQYRDREQRLARIVHVLGESRFPEHFKDESFRLLLERYPEVRRQLIDENFAELIEVPQFRDYLKANGETALEQIDRLVEEAKSKEERTESKKRKIR